MTDSLCRKPKLADSFIPCVFALRESKLSLLVFFQRDKIFSSKNNFFFTIKGICLGGKQMQSCSSCLSCKYVGIINHTQVILISISGISDDNSGTVLSSPA